jgi:hypothetical protein
MQVDSVITFVISRTFMGLYTFVLNRLDFTTDRLVFVIETLIVFFDVLTGRVCTSEMSAKLFASVHFSVSRNVGNYQSVLRNISENRSFQSR